MVLAGAGLTPILALALHIAHWLPLPYGVLLLGGDFIPNIGAWLLGTATPSWPLGYLFRWFGNGGGMGLTFAVLASTISCTRFTLMWLGIGYGVLIWLGLISPPSAPLLTGRRCSSR